jgi:hypothetical protein
MGRDLVFNMAPAQFPKGTGSNAMLAAGQWWN